MKQKRKFHSLYISTQYLHLFEIFEKMPLCKTYTNNKLNVSNFGFTKKCL